MKKLNKTASVVLWAATGLLVLAVLTYVSLTLVIPRLRGPLAAQAYWPTQGWQRSTPEEQSFDSAKLAEGLQAIRQNDIDIHSLLVLRNGLVVVDAYFYPYDGTTVHDLASVTKSLMTTLIGIAADQGKLELDQPMVSFFSGRTIANRDARKERITVKHLASMSSGLDCTAERDEATLSEMQASEDWVQFVLDRKMIDEPGTRFVYCSPGMHLLSAILQQATGMTALEFARHNLFEPLGIREVIWPTDPQGFSHGWGDVYLHPHDAAKLGYLWLNQGQWDGKQIVAREWVENSVKVQMRTGEDDNYGYGWWITGEDNGEEFAAIGRGGQRIQVLRSLNLIVMTTGGGFEFDDILPFVTPALGDMSKPLPANPNGVADLNAALATLLLPPSPNSVTPLPETARAISGKTFVLEPNPTELETLRLEFDDSAEAVMHVTVAGNRQLSPWPIGLDGVYRMSAGEYDLPQGLRGYWADAQTFVFEYDNIANNDHVTFRMQFEADRLVMEGQETAHELGIRIEGRLLNP